jgi:hypothetical protein
VRSCSRLLETNQLPARETATVADFDHLSICLCFDAGVLTGDSAANLALQLSNENNSALLTVLGLGQTIDSLTTFILNLAVTAVSVCVLA